MMKVDCRPVFFCAEESCNLEMSGRQQISSGNDIIPVNIRPRILKQKVLTWILQMYGYGSLKKYEY